MQELIEMSNPGDAETNACLKYHTFWSILHGLISIKMVAPADDTEQLNKLVLDDAITGFIKNLKA